MNLTRTELYALLKKYFKKDEFPKGHIETISDIISGKNVLAIKGRVAENHICYMYPALIIDGIILIISKSLYNKPDAILPTLYINQSILSKHLQKHLREIIDGRYKIIHATPEIFQNKAFLFLLNKIPLSLFVIDDAQCLSRYRYDFDPSYFYIANALSNWKNINILALANACNNKIQDDIKRRLQIGLAETIYLENDFSNLSLEVFSTNSFGEKLKLIGKIIQETEGQGILYANQQSKVIDIKKTLQEIEPSVKEYHTGINRDNRQKIVRDFKNRKIKLIVSVNSLNHELSDCNPSIVVHFDMPNNLEKYHDQIILSCEHNQPLRAIMLCSPSDREYCLSIIEKGVISIVDVWNICDALKKYLGTPNKQDKKEKQANSKSKTLQTWLDKHLNGLNPKARNELIRLKNLYENLPDKDKNPYSLDEYNLYLESDHWRDFSKKILNEYSKCHVCFAKAENIHHLHYRNLRREELADVVPLCHRCHCYIHPDNPMTQIIFEESIRAEQNQYRLFEENESESGQLLIIPYEQLESDLRLERSILLKVLIEMQDSDMLEILPDSSLNAKVSINKSKADIAKYGVNDVTRLLVLWLSANLEQYKEHDVDIQSLSDELSYSINEIENALLMLDHEKAISYNPQNKCLALRIFDLDISLIERNLEKIKGVKYESLRQISDYINTDKCRLSFLVYAITGKQIDDCGKCDNCLSHLQVNNKHKEKINDSIIEAEIPIIDRATIKILICAEKIDGLLGRQDMLKMLIGNNTKRITKYGFDHIEEFGSLSDMSHKEVLKIIDELLELGCLQITSIFFPMIQISDVGRKRLERMLSSSKFHSYSRRE